MITNLAIRPLSVSTLANRFQAVLQRSSAVLIYSALLVFSSHSIGQAGTPDISALCNDLTPANRAMAASAGYDIEELCSSFGSAVGSQKQQRELTPIESRSTISSNPDDEYNQYGSDEQYNQSDRYDQNDRYDRDRFGRQGRPDKMRGQDVRESLERDGEERYRDQDKISSRERLKPFGYDLFAGIPETFSPVTDIPVSPDYLLGPGDTLEVLLYGKVNSTSSLEITRDGTVNFPQLGPVALAGLTFAEAKSLLQTRMSAQTIGVQASISLGELRSMQVFVLGEAFKPGAYTVSSLSTITHALFVSGGVNDIASLRTIQLKRAGNVIATLDLYDLLLRGDTSNDVRLQSSDVIYIPTVSDLVSIDGEVLRPAIYEIKAGEKLADLIQLAGGLKATAATDSARLDRLDGNGFTTVVDVDLDQTASLKVALEAGDHLQVDGISDRKKKIVTLAGHVDFPGDYAWKEGMRVSDLVSSLDKLPLLTDLDFALLVRELSPVGDVETLSVDLRSILQQPKGLTDIELAARDKLMVFSSVESRFLDLYELIGQLKTQSSSGALGQVVTINGSVKFPGEYPLTRDMSVKQLVAAAGGLDEAAYVESIEVNRVDLSDPNLASSRTLLVNLTNQGGGIALQSYDAVLVRAIPEYRQRNTITLEGEVVFPGEYVFARGESLTQLIERAGGFTDYADINAAFFTREALRKAEAGNIQDLQKKMEQELAAQQLDTEAGKLDANALAMQQAALEKLESAEAIGRLVIPLQAIMDQREDDIILASGDKLIIPQFRQEVTIIGEVQRSASHLFRKNLKLSDYIEMSGGMKRSADKRAVYLVKSSGEVVLPRSGLFKFNAKLDQIGPGDTIVVPVDPDGSVKVIPLMADVSRILYELALGAAAINSFGNP